MVLDNIEDYLHKHIINKINIGQSGADVYVVDNEFILKHIVRNKIKNQELFLSHKREAHLYQSINRKKLTCLPEVFYIKVTDEEIILLMKKYRTIEHSEVKDKLLASIMKAIAMVHQYQVPEYLLQNRSEASILANEQIQDCVNGWKVVLKEHKGIFDESPLEKIAMYINSIILWHASGENVLNHGDFHLNNLLIDDDEVVICDWQSVSTGDISNDLSFFLSRLNVDGIMLNEKVVIELYSKAVKELNGNIVDSAHIYHHMHASNLLTSFLFWHQYLHGASEGRVREIYDKMVQSISILINVCED